MLIKNHVYAALLFFFTLFFAHSYGMGPGLQKIRGGTPKTRVLTKQPPSTPIIKRTPISTTDQPQFKPTEPPSAPIFGKTPTGTVGKPQFKPSLRSSPTFVFQQLHASKWIPMSQPEKIASKEMLLENGKALIQEAKDHGLDIKKYELAINLINNINTENIQTTKEMEVLTELFSQLTDLFSQLEKNLIKKLVLELKDLIEEAQEIEIKEETLEPFEKIVKEFSGNIADELLMYGKDEINNALSDLKKHIKQHVEIKEIESRIKAAEKESAQKTTAEQKKQAEIKNTQKAKELNEATIEAHEQLLDRLEEYEKIVPTTIEPALMRQFLALQDRADKDLSLKEINDINNEFSLLKTKIQETEQKLQAEAAAAQQKAIEEQAQLAEAHLTKEIDNLHKQIEKEETVILEQMAEDFIAKEEQKKQLEREQEKAIADAAEEEKLRKEIAETEVEMDQLERKRTDRLLEVEQLKQKMAEKEAALETEIKKEIEAATAQQELHDIEREKALAIIKAESSQAQKEALEAEQKAQEAQQRLDEATIRLQQKEAIIRETQEIEQFEKELAEKNNAIQEIQKEAATAKSNFAQQREQIEAKMRTELEKLEAQFTENNSIKQQIIEKEKNENLARIDAQYNQEMQLLEAQQKEVDKTLDDIRKKIEERKAEKKEEKEKKEKTSSDGGGQIPPTNEYPERAPQEEKKETEKEKGKTGLGAALIAGAFLTPQYEEKEKTEVIPEIVPEITFLPTKETFPTIPEPVEYTAPQIQPTEEPTIPFAGKPAGGTSSRWPQQRFSPYISPTQPPSFTPSIYGGAGTPSAAESIGGTNLSSMNPYTTRIGLPPRVQPQEEKTAPEIIREKKIQPQDIVWWEKMLPNWVVEYLGRKDRTIKEKQKIEKVVHQPAPEEEKPHKEKVSVVKTVIETIKKPIADTIKYIRLLFSDL